MSEPTLVDLGECPTFWGSHGCALPVPHLPLPHRCGDTEDPEDVCSEHTGTLVRYALFSAGPDRFTPGPQVGWSDWLPSETFEL